MIKRTYYILNCKDGTSYGGYDNIIIAKKFLKKDKNAMSISKVVEYEKIVFSKQK